MTIFRDSSMVMGVVITVFNRAASITVYCTNSSYIKESYLMLTASWLWCEWTVAVFTRQFTDVELNPVTSGEHVRSSFRNTTCPNYDAALAGPLRSDKA